MKSKCFVFSVYFFCCCFFFSSFLFLLFIFSFVRLFALFFTYSLLCALLSFYLSWCTRGAMRTKLHKKKILTELERKFNWRLWQRCTSYITTRQQRNNVKANTWKRMKKKYEMMKNNDVDDDNRLETKHRRHTQKNAFYGNLVELPDNETVTTK